MSPDADGREDRLAGLLAEHFAPDAVIADPAAAAAAGQVWNGRARRRPLALVRCESVDDVRAAVFSARDTGVAVSVLAGGHNPGGTAVRDGGLVIDLRSMREVTIDGDTATIGGGATVSDVLDAAVAAGKSAVVGTVGSVGATGMTMNGGYGVLIGAAGLAIDNLISAQVVLADGCVVEASADDEPDLFWALRGGGNFGVVTRIRARLFPRPEVTTGQIVFPIEQARDVLMRLPAVTDTADDHLDVMFMLGASPAGGQALVLLPTWSGAAPDAGPAIDAVRTLGAPVADQVATMSLSDAVHATDGVYAAGANYAISNRIVPSLSEGAVAALLDSTAEMTATCYLNVHHAHGAATRVPVEATAHAYRHEHYVVEIIAVWVDGDGAAEQAWVKHTESRLDDVALPGLWTALTGEVDDRTRDAYGPNTQRLLEVKKAYDPHGAFTATPLP